jgi:PAS domain S-box-containing protein
VTNPALRALEDGMIVGLANHTLLICKDGTERPIDDSAAPIKEQNGEVIGAVLVFRDVTERRQLEKQNQERFAAAQFLASIVESSDDAIVSKSLEGIIQSWNFGAERLYGFSAEEAVGQPISLIVPPERAEEEEQIISRLRKGERMDHFETIRLRKDRTPIHVSLTISPIKDETGNVVAISKITRDVTERKLAAMRIEQLLTQLKEADRRKDEFLATLAHELRNPLAPIRTGLDVMKIAKDDPVAIEQVRSTMERQAQQLVTLVDDLLDVSRITQGKFQLKKRRVLLGEIVESAVEATRPFVETGSHELTVTVPSVEIFLDADPNRLAQVISNLIINACKFTPQGGKIWLRVELHKNGVTVTVQDTGMGIPTDKLDRIFEMFAQIDSPTGTSQTGLGIGLTLVKSLVEMHGGTITARSDGPQRGSEFSIQLPTLSEGSVLQNAPSTPDAIPRSHQRRVLVVDDNTSAAEVLGMLVKMLGNEVRIACNGEQAVEQAAEFRPHLILMDLGMPIVDGYEAARRIRQQTWGKEIMLVALTGWGQDEDKRRTKQAGFDDHLVKPAASADLQKLFAKMEPKSNN